MCSDLKSRPESAIFQKQKSGKRWSLKSVYFATKCNTQIKVCVLLLFSSSIFSHIRRCDLKTCPVTSGVSNAQWEKWVWNQTGTCLNRLRIKREEFDRLRIKRKEFGRLRIKRKEFDRLRIKREESESPIKRVAPVLHTTAIGQARQDVSYV